MGISQFIGEQCTVQADPGRLRLETLQAITTRDQHFRCLFMHFLDVTELY